MDIKNIIEKEKYCKFWDISPDKVDNDPEWIIKFRCHCVSKNLNCEGYSDVRSLEIMLNRFQDGMLSSNTIMDLIKNHNDDPIIFDLIEDKIKLSNLITEGYKIVLNRYKSNRV